MASPPFHYEKAMINGMPCYKVTKDEGLFTAALDSLLQKPVFIKDKFIFPGPLPVSLTMDIIQRKLKKPRTDYVVLEKNDGDRACLVFARVNGLKVTFMVGRQGAVYLLPALKFLDHKTFLGGVFDAELINDQGRHCMVIFDCMALAGSTLENMTYRDRLDACTKYLGSHYKSSPDDKLIMAVKKPYSLNELPVFMNRYNELDAQGKVDGIIFAPNVSGVVYARDLSMFKWKAPIKNTIDFLHDRGSLYVYDKGRNTKVAEITSANAWRDGAILECFFDVGPKTWVPIKERCDKKFSNDHKTLSATMKTIQDAIDITVLVRELHGQNL